MVKPILPRQNSLAAASHPTQATDVMAVTTDEAPQPRRRGRKPGPLSRSAREAQRKLNHSIIEKARRTKINEALAALRQLVPPDYGKRRDQDSISEGRELSNGDENDEYDDDDDDDGDGEYGAPQRKAVVANKNATGKKEEKEFKLEVLERTVTYLQDLTKRYEGLHKEHEQLLLGMRRCRCHEEETSSRKRGRSDAESPSNSADTGSQTDKRPSKRHEPLPSISSLLSLSPDSTPYALDILPSGSRHTTVAPLFPPYLPTPPSSARFRPTQTPVSPMNTTSTKSSHIPSLSLGPTALPLPSSTTQSIPEGHKRRHSISQSSVSSTSSNDGARPYIKPPRVEASPAFPSSPNRTREDETVASLLLTLRSPTSPRHPPATSPLLHTSSSRRQSISHAASPPPSLALPLPERLTISETLKKGDYVREFVSPAQVIGGNTLKSLQQVETPGSLLGLTLYKNRN